MRTLPHTITTLIEVALNRYLDLDPDTRVAIESMSGKLIKITVRELDIQIIMQVSENRINVLPSWDGDFDSEMRASVFALIKLSMTPDAGTSALGGDIEMSGDLESGRQFRDLIGKVDIDWEEILSQYTGDIVAHKIGNGIRAMAQWSRKSSGAIQKNVTEYLQEESRQLPSEFEIKHFLTSVDELRLATDRAEAKLKNLVKSLQAIPKREAQ